MGSVSTDLRQAVLQAAMQGKLTEQLPEDGNAMDLLKQIKLEKEWLIKEKKIKKEKELAPITEDEIPFDIPDNWEWCRLGNVLKISTGNKDANYGTKDGKYPFFTCSKEPIKSPNFSFEGECLLLPGNGANIGLVLYYNGKFEAYQRTYVLEKLLKITDMRYLQYALIWNWKKYNNIGKMYGSAIPFIKLLNLKNYIFPLPPLSEQHRIVACVEELMAKIDELEVIENNLRDLHQAFPNDMNASLLQAAMQGKLTEQLPEDGNLQVVEFNDTVYSFPSDWKIKLFKDLTFVLPKVDKYDGIKDYYSTGSITSKGVIPAGQFSYNDRPSRAGRTAVLHSVIEAKMKDTVKATIIDEQLENSLLSTGFFQIGLSTEYLQEYIRYYLLSPLFISQKNYYCTGTTQKAINDANLRKIFIPFPPLAEQKRIVEKLDRLLPLCDSLQNEL